MSAVRKYRNHVGIDENKHLYSIWKNMIVRCEREDCDRYMDYGGRGISVCPEWHDFDNFADWAHEANYQIGLTIDRVDNDGNYEPSNCQWITRQEQNRNKRDSIIVEYMGEKKPLVIWCEELGLKYDPMHNRVSKGWDAKTAFETPLRTELKSFSGTCREHGINPATVRDRVVKFGWSMEEALNTPTNGRGTVVKTYRSKEHHAKCGVCGKDFIKNNSRQKYCCDRCHSVSKFPTFRMYGKLPKDIAEATS